MMRLSEIPYSFEQSLDECVAGITGNKELHSKLVSGREALLALETQYADAARVGELYKIQPIISGEELDPFVISGMKKSELVKIYDQYFVPVEKPARKVYDALMNAAKESCPFCGGIGTPRNLDHFLPKANFPQFSVLPSNLVPSCRDCNMDGKAANFAREAEEQIIQPYMDSDDFFNVQWIFAHFHRKGKEAPGEFEYYVDPPEIWPEVDKKRARHHFESFALSKRYATKAAQMLGTVLRQVESMRSAGCDSGTIRIILLQPGVDGAPFVNHWQTGMYQALIEEVCSSDQ